MAGAIIHNHDMIARVARPGQAGAVEIGPIPGGVGLERLRWTGAELVDLADLDEIHVKPSGGGYELHAVEVPGSQAVAMSYADRKRLVTEDGVIRALSQAEAEAREADEAFADMTARITTAADAALSAYLAEYGETERTSFYKQLEEARAIQADPEAETPMLDAMVAARQDPDVPDAAELAAKVLAKDALFTALSGSIVGQRQAKHIALKALYAAGDVAGMRALDLTYVLPEAG